jgi:small subunit ribosomal protein S11
MTEKENLEKQKEETEENLELDIKEEVAKEKPKKDSSKIEKEPTKSKKPKEEKTGIAYIKATPNNTLVHITDLSGNTISRFSGGMVTKHSRLKANPTIAMFVAKRAAERAKDLGFTSLYIRMKGKTGLNHGPGAHSSVKSLGKEGFNILSILDSTKYPRGGPKKKGGRRGRRV